MTKHLGGAILSQMRLKQPFNIFLLSLTVCFATYAKDLKRDFKTDLMDKTEQEVLKFRGKPEKINECLEYKSLQLKALYWRMRPPDKKYGYFWHEIIIKDGKVCSDARTTGDNCR